MDLGLLARLGDTLLYRFSGCKKKVSSWRPLGNAKSKTQLAPANSKHLSGYERKGRKGIKFQQEASDIKKVF